MFAFLSRILEPVLVPNMLGARLKVISTVEQCLACKTSKKTCVYQILQSRDI